MAAAREGAGWAKRYQDLREAEWEERWKTVEFAAEVRRRWMARAERCGTLEGYARLLELASKLGRSACEKPTERTEVSGPDGGPIRVEVQAALKKIYGRPLPGEVVDVQVEPAKPVLFEPPAVLSAPPARLFAPPDSLLAPVPGLFAPSPEVKHD